VKEAAEQCGRFHLIRLYALGEGATASGTFQEWTIKEKQEKFMENVGIIADKMKDADVM
jgi:hypothetical protein